MKSTLLIIGNGFDLHCSLKSSFSSFFYSEIRNREGFKEFLHVHQLWMTNDTNFKSAFCDFMITYKSLLFDTLSIWDLFFIMKYNRSKHSDEWNQVEKIILDSFKLGAQKDEAYYSWEFFKRILYNDGEYSLENIKDITSHDDHVLLRLVLVYFDHLQTNNNCTPTGRIVINSSTRVSSWERFLLQQLKIFEKHFCFYLREEVESCKTFQQSAIYLFRKILRRQHRLFVMSFNYTNYPSADFIQSIENVHGTLNSNNIIFGVDDEDIPADSINYVFTKTCRKLFRFTEESNEITSVLSKSIGEIAFYGHSLSKQDHSYFKAIFDFYEIYSSEIKLRFFYSIYDKDQVESINTNVVKSTIALMKSYGKTLTKTDHGANLLHKLLIENRLQIIEID